MSTKFLQRSLAIPLVLGSAALCAWGSSSGGPGVSSLVSFRAATAAGPAPAPFPGGTGGATPSAQVCPSDTPRSCPEGCCPGDRTCGADGGCDSPPISLTCPGEAPTYCESNRAADSSSKGNDLFVAAPAAFAPGRFGNGVSIGCQAASCAPLVQGKATGFPVGDGQTTLEAWIRPSPMDRIMSILSSGGSTPARALRIAPSSTGTQFWWLVGSGSCGVEGPTVFDGAWHFIALTFGRQQMGVFVDAAPLPAQPCARTDFRADPGTVVIGGDGEGNAFVGVIDEVRVLDFAADPAQIAGDFQAGPLTAIPGTVGLWHFDDAGSAWCCPAGVACSADSDTCAATSLGDASCPADAPVACAGGCCPQGSTCIASGLCNVGTPGCPSGAPVDCGDGTCCPTGYTCVGGSCVLNPATPPSAACPAGTVLASNSTRFCCPSPGGSYDGSRCVSGACAPGQACALGYSCSNPTAGGSCIADATPALCTPNCMGGCCADRATCGPSGCCPPGEPPCAGACCSAGQCVRPPAALPPNPCAAGCVAITHGGAVVCRCPGGTPMPTGPRCGEGLRCRPGEVCAAPGLCCPGTLPKACGNVCCGSGATRGVDCGCPAGFTFCGQECCPPGVACEGTRCPDRCADPAFPTPCGDWCCAAGVMCVNNACGCPEHHPVLCPPIECCLAGGTCTNGTCGCPPGRELCGDVCCAAGDVCANGACRAGGGGGGGPIAPGCPNRCTLGQPCAGYCAAGSVACPRGVCCTSCSDPACVMRQGANPEACGGDFSTRCGQGCCHKCLSCSQRGGLFFCDIPMR